MGVGALLKGKLPWESGSCLHMAMMIAQGDDATTCYSGLSRARSGGWLGEAKQKDTLQTAMWLPESKVLRMPQGSCVSDAFDGGPASIGECGNFFMQIGDRGSKTGREGIARCN